MSTGVLGYTDYDNRVGGGGLSTLTGFLHQIAWIRLVCSVKTVQTTSQDGQTCFPVLLFKNCQRH